MGGPGLEPPTQGAIEPDVPRPPDDGPPADAFVPPGGHLPPDGFVPPDGHRPPDGFVPPDGSLPLYDWPPPEPYAPFGYAHDAPTFDPFAPPPFGAPSEPPPGYGAPAWVPGPAVAFGPHSVPGNGHPQDGGPGAPPAEPTDGGRLPRWLRLPRSRRGILALLLVLGGLAAMGVFGSVQAIHWTETADFCGRCHTMAPELLAYELGPHREVTCGECHVEPGVQGWMKAKINGSRQLAEVLMGTFPAPIPPPEHSSLPSTNDTCLRCHSPERLTTSKLVTRTQFTEDEPNSRQFVALMVRPGSGDVFDVDRSVHWHVLQDVEYIAADPGAQEIDWVGTTLPDGSFREFIAQDRIRVSEDVTPELEAIKETTEPRRMDCISCHNRVGHPILSPRKGADQRMTLGQIDPSLPFIKREAMRILWSGFPSDAAADTEAERLRDFYRLEYPQVADTKAGAIDQAIEQIKELYRLTATPEMRVTAGTYPDNLGHIDFVGCFRCHDGGHYLVADGAVTEETIPSTCDTCHTFPQLGPAVASLPMGTPPESHDDPIFVFSHKDVATDIDPGSQTCGECHARDYCINCHSTGAVTVDHDEMLTNHAETIRVSGSTSCAYCHQQVYCARCHTEDVLPRGSVAGAAPTEPVAGIEWALRTSSAGP